MRYLIFIFLILTSCKTSQKCEAYSEEFDVHKEHLEAQKKFTSVTTLRK